MHQRPLERYSGTFTSDLFAEAEATYFDDAGQFHALQRQAVEQMAAERAASAAFVDVFDTHGAPWWHYRAAREGESGGVVINLTPAGRVEVRDGLVRHEVPAAVVAETRECPLAVKRERSERMFPTQGCRPTCSIDIRNALRDSFFQRHLAPPRFASPTNEGLTFRICNMAVQVERASGLR